MANFNKIPKSEMDETEIATEMSEQFRVAKLYLDPVHLRMNQQEELYRTYIDKNNYPHSARVFDPRIFRVIETITPRMVANEPTGSFYPAESGDDTTAQILNSMTKYDWRRAEMFPKEVMFVKSMLIFGTSFGRNFWDFREKEKTQMEPKKINGRLVWTPTNTKKIKITEFDGPNFETLNIYDCFPDPNSSTLQNMRWFIYRTFSTIDELEDENDARGAEYWKNLDKLRNAIDKKKQDKNNLPGGGQPQDMQFREHRRIMLSTQEFHGKDSSNPEFVILRRLTRERWVYIVPEFNLVIREEDNPYFHGDLPIVYGVDYPYPGELYGMGEIEPLDRIQRAINAVLNQRLDNVQLTLRTMWKVRKGGGVDMHTLVSAPGNIVTTEDMNAVEPLQTPDVTGGTFVQTMNYLTGALQNGSGITDYTIGVQKSGDIANKTATGAQLIQNEANAQFKLKIQLYHHMVIQRIVNQWKDLRIQYTTEAQKLRIIGKDEVDKLKENTQLSQTTPDGEQILPGELEKKAILEISKDEAFAFLHVLPDNIQPSLVGDYDFISTVSVDQLNDPNVMQQNFFSALDRVMTPEWSQLLMRGGKMINATALTPKVFEKLQIGIDGKNVLVDMPKGQPVNFDPPRVVIPYDSLPKSGKISAASNAGIQIDPNDPQLNQMGTENTRVIVDPNTPAGAAIAQNEGILPNNPTPSSEPMGQEDMSQIMQQTQDQRQQITNQIAGNQPGQTGGMINGQ